MKQVVSKPLADDQGKKVVIKDELPSQPPSHSQNKQAVKMEKNIEDAPLDSVPSEGPTTAKPKVGVNKSPSKVAPVDHDDLLSTPPSNSKGKTADNESKTDKQSGFEPSVAPTVVSQPKKAVKMTPSPTPTSSKKPAPADGNIVSSHPPLHGNGTKSPSVESTEQKRTAEPVLHDNEIAADITLSPSVPLLDQLSAMPSD